MGGRADQSGGVSWLTLGVATLNALATAGLAAAGRSLPGRSLTAYWLMMYLLLSILAGRVVVRPRVTEPPPAGQGRAAR